MKFFCFILLLMFSCCLKADPELAKLEKLAKGGLSIIPVSSQNGDKTKKSFLIIGRAFIPQEYDTVQARNKAREEAFINALSSFARYLNNTISSSTSIETRSKEKVSSNSAAVTHFRQTFKENFSSSSKAVIPGIREVCAQVHNGEYVIIYFIDEKGCLAFRDKFMNLFKTVNAARKKVKRQFPAIDGFTIPFAYEVHPEIAAAIKNYPPLAEGGSRVCKLSRDRFIVIGIGKALMTGSFINVSRKAELDAEVQIARVLTPAQITVETSSSSYFTDSSDGGSEYKFSYRNFFESLISSQNPYITSCGFWKHGKYLYCARAVFVGRHDFLKKDAAFNERAVDFSIQKQVPELAPIIEQLSYLKLGGTILLKAGQTPFLLTAVAVPLRLPGSRKLIFARNLAYRNLIAFISGGKLEHQLAVLTEELRSNSDKNVFRRNKRKKQTMALKGHVDYLEPLAKWKIHGVQADFFLYAVELPRN